MADESKKENCSKCSTFFWVDKHHILPKAIFKGKGPTVKLCPNCHRDYHEQLGRENLKNPDEAFHYAFFIRWASQESDAEEGK
jgi:hypothetical protein